MEVLEAAEGVLDKVAVAVAILVVAGGALAVAATRDDPDSACITQQAPKLVGIIAVISQQLAHASGALEKRGRSSDLAHVAGGEHQRIGEADDVGKRVDFRGPATRQAADRLRRAPPFAPNAARCAFTYVLSIAVFF
nr:hypothetical protein TQ38_28430 [Novosphingobium sp. P6W]